MVDEITDSTVEVTPTDRSIPGIEEAMPDYFTQQQRIRDEYNTDLFKQFVEAYREKRDFAKIAKNSISIWCIICVSLLILACIGLSGYTLIWTTRQVTDVIALLSAVIPLIIAIIGTLNIVTKYVFPENEEQHITDIVNSINKNDLDNKLANINRAQTIEAQTAKSVEAKNNTNA